MKYDLSYLELELRELLKKLKKHNTYAMQLENEIILYKLENDRLKEDTHKAVQQLGSKINNLQQRIDKAIEYIEQQYKYEETAKEDYDNLLNILQGSDKND